MRSTYQGDNDEIKHAFPRSTQMIEVEAFVTASEIAFVLLERPYYLEPIGKGERVYALLRESMLAAGVVGIARVVIHAKEHLAVLVPSGAALVLNTIRWASEIRPLDDLKLPAPGKAAGSLKPSELKMAAQLIQEMTGAWKPEAYNDTFADAIHALVKRKSEAGEARQVTALEVTTDAASTSNVLDLTELLAQSLAKRSAPAAKARKRATPK